MRYSLDKNPHTFQESYMELDGGGVVIDLYSSSGGSITPKLSTLAYNQYGDSARRGEPFPHKTCPEKRFFRDKKIVSWGKRR